MNLKTILQQLDFERRVCGKLSEDGALTREFSPDHTGCRILFSDFAQHEVERLIQREVKRAEANASYTLEWKVYSHDVLVTLGSKLL